MRRLTKAPTVLLNAVACFVVVWDVWILRLLDSRAVLELLGGTLRSWLVLSVPIIPVVLLILAFKHIKAGAASRAFWALTVPLTIGAYALQMAVSLAWS